TVDMRTQRLDGDRRVHILRWDTEKGVFALDERFKDENTGDEGVSFDRDEWPHGRTGPARPHGVLFIAPIDERGVAIVVRPLAARDAGPAADVLFVAAAARGMRTGSVPAFDVP